MRDFGKANVLQGYTEDEAGAGKHRGNRFTKLPELFSECSTTWAPALHSHVLQGTNPIWPSFAQRRGRNPIHEDTYCPPSICKARISMEWSTGLFSTTLQALPGFRKAAFRLYGFLMLTQVAEENNTQFLRSSQVQQTFWRWSRKMNKDYLDFFFFCYPFFIF